MNVQSGEFAQGLKLMVVGNHGSQSQQWAVSKDSANMFVLIRNKEEIVALLCTPRNPSHFSS